MHIFMKGETANINIEPISMLYDLILLYYTHYRSLSEINILNISTAHLLNCLFSKTRTNYENKSALENFM